jgi:hypothetical protein
MSVRPLSKAKSLAHESQKKMAYKDQFTTLTASSMDNQTEHFLKSFIFALGDEWKSVVDIASAFKRYLSEKSETVDLDPIQAADFLQRNGKTRTALQRKSELLDVDLDKNGRVGLTEYLLLHFKHMILTEYFKRHDIQPTVSLDNDAIGLVNVGDMLLEELFTVRMGIDPEVQAAIEEFMALKRAKEAKVADLSAKAAGGGVKGLTAKAELLQLGAMDTTNENRVEITLNAAKRRAGKECASVVLEKQKKAEEQQILQKRRDSRLALAERAKMFESKANVA